MRRQRIPYAPGPADAPRTPEVIADEVETTTSLAVDGDALYWTGIDAGGLGSVRSWNKSSRALALVADARSLVLPRSRSPAVRCTG